eukprot:19363_1
MSKRPMDNEHSNTNEPPLKKRKIGDTKQDNGTDSTEQLLSFYEGELDEKNNYNAYGNLKRITHPCKLDKLVTTKTKYIGNFANGAFNGFGILYLNCDCTSLLIGNWNNNELNGLGIMINELEYISFGKWINGIENGTFKEYEFHTFEFDFNQFIYNKIQNKYDKRLNE